MGVSPDVHATGPHTQLVIIHRGSLREPRSESITPSFAETPSFGGAEAGGGSSASETAGEAVAVLVHYDVVLHGAVSHGLDKSLNDQCWARGGREGRELRW